MWLVMMVCRSSELAHTAAIFASEVAGEATAPRLRVPQFPQSPPPARVRRTRRRRLTVDLTPEAKFATTIPGAKRASAVAGFGATRLAAQATFRSLRAVRPTAMRIDWALKALLTEEPWAQFVWFMFSLQQLTHEHFPLRYNKLVAMARSL